jgi:LacI family transcriptional regulator
MRDVARLAGVSTSTVSAVINNKGIVGPELTSKVKAAIEALGFAPHIGARGLRLGRTNVIGLILPDITNPFFVQVMRGIEDEAIKNGYSLMVCNSNLRSSLEMKHLEVLNQQRVGGLLVAPADSYAARDLLVRNCAPVVFIMNVPMKMKVNCVVVNDFEASYEATHYLIGLGHRRIAFIGGRLIFSASVERVEGYRKAMQESALPLCEELEFTPGEDIGNALHVCLKLLRSTAPPTAIFCLNNRLLLGVLRALRELRIACPEQVSVMGFDDLDWAQVFDPSITVIAEPSYETGQKSVQLLLDCIESSEGSAEVEPREVVLKCSLCIRESTARVVASIEA